MRPQDVHHLFTNFTFNKPSEEIVDKAKLKASDIRVKREARIARVKGLREEYGIDDAAMNEILLQARAIQASAAMTLVYNSSKRQSDGTVLQEKAQIGAGIANMFLTEHDFIQAEGEQAEKLELIVRNLKDVLDKDDKLRGHTLSYEELRFLGF
jgi:hypothetical protein